MLPTNGTTDIIIIMSCMGCKWVTGLFWKDLHTTRALILWCNEPGSQRDSKFTQLGPGLKIVEEPFIKTIRVNKWLNASRRRGSNSSNRAHDKVMNIACVHVCHWCATTVRGLGNVMLCCQTLHPTNTSLPTLPPLLSLLPFVSPLHHLYFYRFPV